MTYPCGDCPSVPPFRSRAAYMAHRIAFHDDAPTAVLDSTRTPPKASPAPKPPRKRPSGKARPAAQQRAYRAAQRERINEVAAAGVVREHHVDRPRRCEDCRDAILLTADGVRVEDTAVTGRPRRPHRCRRG